MNKTFGELLREHRLNAKKTMGDVARHLEVTVPYISEVENNHRAPMTPDRVMQACDLFGTDPTPLLRAAAKVRGSFELPAKGSAKAHEAAAALMRGWKTIEDEMFDEILNIVNRPGRK